MVNYLHCDFVMMNKFPGVVSVFVRNIFTSEIKIVAIVSHIHTSC